MRRTNIPKLIQYLADSKKNRTARKQETVTHLAYYHNRIKDKARGNYLKLPLDKAIKPTVFSGIHATLPGGIKANPTFFWRRRRRSRAAQGRRRPFKPPPMYQGCHRCGRRRRRRRHGRTWKGLRARPRPPPQSILSDGDFTCRASVSWRQKWIQETDANLSESFRLEIERGTDPQVRSPVQLVH